MEVLELGRTSCGYIETDPTGRYGRFQEVLGRGATKKVYRAFNELEGMEVAWNQVKLDDMVQSPQDLKRLHSEIHLLRTLNHGSVIRFYDSWIDMEKRTLNFITEMFTSGTLREYRKKYKRVNIKAFKNWAHQILEGLVYLHEHDPPVIHRDLKCDNIFVNGHLGQVKIGDLGLAAILRSSQAARTVIGTPEFMAPEFYEEEYNELVDVYSFGMCMLEMFTSEYPYSECCNPVQIFKKVTSGKLPDAFYKITDKETRTFIGKCLEKASKRLKARELLSDPFFDSIKDGPISDPSIRKSPMDAYKPGSTHMTVNGEMNPGGDTISLTVKIMGRDGNFHDVHFPFHLVSDTAIDVATEMVKELRISYEPSEIAQMISEEVSSLVPDSRSTINNQIVCPPFLSSQGEHPELFLDEDERDSSPHEIQGGSLRNGETFSKSPHCHSSYNQCTSTETGVERGSRWDVSSPNLQPSRFCPMRVRGQLMSQRTRKSRCGQKSIANRYLGKLKAFVDIRSQLINRSLQEDVHRRRLCRTVGAVENIAFQKPCEIAARLKNVSIRDDPDVRKFASGDDKVKCKINI